jgi:flavin-dependent dehydrogenase
LDDVMIARRLDTDVVVVGARAAGAATAMLLARAGVDTIAVDRSRYGADTLSTHAMMRAGVVQLHRWGLLDTIAASGAPAIRSATFHHEPASWRIDIRPGNGIDALYAARRTVLDPVLVDAASAAGAQIRHGITVTGLTRDGTGRVTGVVGHDTRGRMVSITARVVVGADGLRSIVASEVDAAVERRGRAAGAYIYGYWDGVEVSGYESVFGPGTSAGLIPTNDDLVCVFAGTHCNEVTADHRVGRLSSDVAGDYVRLLRRASGPVAERVLAGTPRGRLRRFTGPPGMIRRAGGAGWALVGDAGYWKDPISAHGLSDALRDAELLAGSLLSALSGSGSDELESLRDFQHRRDLLSSDLFDVTDTLAAGAWADDTIAELLRSLSGSMIAEVEALEALDPWPPGAARPSTIRPEVA